MKNHVYFMENLPILSRKEPDVRLDMKKGERRKGRASGRNTGKEQFYGSRFQKQRDKG